MIPDVLRFTLSCASQRELWRIPPQLSFQQKCELQQRQNHPFPNGRQLAFERYRAQKDTIINFQYEYIKDTEKEYLMRHLRYKLVEVAERGIHVDNVGPVAFLNNWSF